MFVQTNVFAFRCECLHLTENLNANSTQSYSQWRNRYPYAKHMLHAIVITHISSPWQTTSVNLIYIQYMCTYILSV